MLIVFAISITLSRSGWTGLAAGLLAFLMLAPWRLRWWVELVAAAAILATIVFLAVPAATTQSQVFQEAFVRSANTTGRESLWSLTPPLISDSLSHLIAGRGLDVFFGTGRFDDHLAVSPILPQGGPHNEFLRALIEQGAIGLVLLVGWTLGSALVGYRRLRELPPRAPERIVLAAFTSAVICIVVASLTHDTSHSVPVVVVTALVTGVLVTLASSRPGGVSDESQL